MFRCIEDANRLTCRSILNNVKKNLIVYKKPDAKRAKYVQVRKMKRVRTVSINMAPDNAI